MNQLTQEQIKTPEDAFASYPEDFHKTPKFTSMEGIQEQLASNQVDDFGNPYVVYITHLEKNEDGFSMHKMMIGEPSSK